MGVYTRYKRTADGVRQLVELWEITPKDRRQKMIDAGMQEDPEYTNKIMQYLLNFQDIEKLPDLELSEVITATPPRMSAYAFHNSAEDVKARVIRCAKPQIAAEVRDLLGATVGPREIGGAQLKVIEIARKLEKRGIVKTKRVPE